ncbi:aminotransferase class III-fold pyridoxal phosphate-dependent enzyme [Neobacillus drentensis]|uniref:aminotransferase class III-fold pyridoxal phosphate-dependent enzyme n=1 Tax=Neobacillus drentensis TaxID=220684 RepID=UPI00300053D9
MGIHGSTFGGNPVSIAASIATIDAIFIKEYLDEVVDKSEFLFKHLLNNLKHFSINEKYHSIMYCGIQKNLYF